MKVLLDTHIAIWWFQDPNRLDKAARQVIADQNSTVFLSAASVWEAAIKEAAGRLEPPRPLLESAVDEGFIELPIRSHHARRAAALPMHHRDPFDRMLIAQALEESLVILTRDAIFRSYPAALMIA
ncbi:MAG: type II toxin-antitoxin system VapC family toxin [Candidatus Dormibacteraceae bacterium]